MKHKLNRAIDSEFWRFITKDRSHKDVLGYKDYIKDNFLKQLEKDVNSYHHHFQQPIYYYYPKPSGILRPIKDFSLEDFCIYYYTVKEIQDELVNEIKKVDGVFGGFRITGPLKTPNVELKYDPEYEKFNKFGFRENWNNYQKMAFNLYNSKYQYYIHLDIAHFYNDINLDILEKEVRSVVHKKTHIVDLLFHFLKNSEKKDLGYSLSNVGLPQEDVGEMSRLLANFYLAPIDRFLRNQLPKILGSRCKYYDFIRFADDIWIAVDVKGSSDLTYIIQKISLKLQARKLHINEKKLTFLSNKEFYDYWKFSEWDKIDTIRGSIPDLIKFTENIFKRQSGRWFTPFNYATQIISKSGNHVFFSKKSAQRYCERTLLNSQLSTKITQQNISFYKELMDLYPSIRTTIKRYLKSSKNIFPSVEHNLIHLLSFDIQFNKAFIIDFLKLTPDWYTKCLILKTLADTCKAKQINLSTQELSSILRATNTMKRNNDIERRYIHYFLFHVIPAKLDEEPLQNSDQAFIEFLMRGR